MASPSAPQGKDDNLDNIMSRYYLIPMLVNVLLYEAGTESEGIHSLELKGKTVILMLKNDEKGS